MQRNEEIRVVLAREPQPLVERDEDVLAAGQADIVATVRGQDRSELAGDGEHNILLDEVGTGDGAWIGAAVARVDQDHRTGVGGFGGFLDGIGTAAVGDALLGWARARLLQGHKTSGIDPNEIEGQVRRRTLTGRNVRRVLDQHGASDVNHEARFVGGEQSIAVSADEAVPALSGGRRKLEVETGNIDDDAVGCAEHEDLREHRARQLEVEPGALIVALDPRSGGDGASPGDLGGPARAGRRRGGTAWTHLRGRGGALSRCRSDRQRQQQSGRRHPQDCRHRRSHTPRPCAFRRPYAGPAPLNVLFARLRQHCGSEGE